MMVPSTLANHVRRLMWALCALPCGAVAVSAATIDVDGTDWTMTMSFNAREHGGVRGGKFTTVDFDFNGVAERDVPLSKWAGLSGGLDAVHYSDDTAAVGWEGTGRIGTMQAPAAAQFWHAVHSRVTSSRHSGFTVNASAVSEPIACPRKASFQAAIRHLAQTFDSAYPQADEFLARLDELNSTEDRAGLDAFRREALLANPLVAGQPLNSGKGRWQEHLVARILFREQREKIPNEKSRKTR